RAVPIVCSQGQPDADHTVILAGDSKASQWHPAIAPLAAANGWNLEMLAYSGCPLTTAGLPTVDGVPYTTCMDWIPTAIDYIIGADPDLLILGGGRVMSYE